MRQRPRVTVVVPAYNAESTIDATLRSVRAQSLVDIEILVIDDGSSDETPEIATMHARADGRVRLIRQANGGVAAARNAGIEAAQGDYIAPVDADDLCAFRRLEKQVHVLDAAGTGAAVCYTWSAFIDENDRIIDASYMPEHRGDVASILCETNFVANGSAAMFRTEALQESGGYDPSLRARKAQGCEDWALLLRLAEQWQFVVVPEFLTGYRQSADNMSSNSLQMYRSFKLVAADHVARFPHARAALELGRKNMLAWLLDLAGRDRRHKEVALLAGVLARRSPRWAYRILAPHYLGRTQGRASHGHDQPAGDLRAPRIGGRFPIGDPDEAATSQTTRDDGALA